MRRMIVPGAAAALLLVLVAVGWTVLRPGWAANMLVTHVEQQLGRRLEVKGGASLEFSPRLAIRLDSVSLANPESVEGRFLTARAIRIPVGMGQLLSRTLSFRTLELEGAELALLLNERGEASWAFPAVKTPEPLRLIFADGAMRFYDARTTQAFALSGLSAALDVDPEGGIALRGTATMGGRLAKIDAALKSLARVQEDGSPLDLTVEVPDASASFSGRVSTRNQLALAGTATLASPDLRVAARWAGLAVEAAEVPMPLAVSGGLESIGNSFATRRGDISLAGERARGDVILDLRGLLPKLQAALSMQALRLAPFLADAGRPDGGWGLRPFDLSPLKAIDADLTVDAGTVTVGEAVMGPARLTVNLAGGTFRGGLAVPVLGKGKLDLAVTWDATATPPVFGLNLRGDGVDAHSVLPLLVPVTWLNGMGRIEATLTGSGRTEQEVMGTLGGTVRLSLANGAIAGPDAIDLLGAVSQRIVDGWDAGQGAGQTVFDTLDIEATLADGIATLNRGQIAGKDLTLEASGGLDLLRRAIDVSLKTRLDAGSGSAALPVPVIVRGPWGNPRIYPDLPDVLANPSEAFARLKAMGLPAGN